MNGLILSKDAGIFAHHAQLIDAQFSAQLCGSVAEVSLLPSSVTNRITWLLAEPALACDVMNILPNLRWVQSTWAGVERMLAHPRRDYTLTNIRGVFAPLISEYVLAHCLAHERQLYVHREAQAQGIWFNDTLMGEHRAHVGSLQRKTALILGVGSIGAGLASVLRGLGVRVLGVVSTLRDVPECDVLGTMADLPILLPQADYVVNTLPNTPLTINLINAEFLHRMKSSSLLINVGRGQAVVEQDLSDALHTGRIAGAILDVYRTEPLPKEHIFWQTPRLSLTSHTAAPSFPVSVFEVFWDNYLRFTSGEALRHVVDFNKGY